MGYVRPAVFNTPDWTLIGSFGPQVPPWYFLNLNGQKEIGVAVWDDRGVGSSTEAVKHTVGYTPASSPGGPPVTVVKMTTGPDVTSFAFFTVTANFADYVSGFADFFDPNAVPLGGATYGFPSGSKLWLPAQSSFELGPPNQRSSVSTQEIFNFVPVAGGGGTLPPSPGPCEPIEHPPYPYKGFTHGTPVPGTLVHSRKVTGQ